ncbi:hypothetical protein ACER0A_010365 [Haloimpatiens sp. FM7315]|uniref:hypothetical protein n=1 Tax=Haloimpatiens sp. FM7315 TaxID=3298609 RepID=UPI00370A0B21
MNRNVFTSKPTAYAFVFFLIISMANILEGCSFLEIKDNKVYEVNQDKNQEDIKKIDGQINIDQENKFVNLNFQCEDNKIPVAQSMDKRYVFYLKPVNLREEIKTVIYGETYYCYNLIKYDNKNKEDKIIKRNIPLISLAKWNPNGKIIAFIAKDKLLIYDMNKDKFVFEDEVKKDYVKYFGWSPDGKRLYTEHPDLVNNTIYYMNSNEKVEAYNSKETIYYKGNIENKYYYATINEINKPSMNKVCTLIVDKDGNKIKKLANGKFRDNYKLSTLLIGENDFNLYYFKNVNTSNKPKIITKEKVYDAKFIYNGNIAYIIKNKDMSKNNFLLFVIDSYGREIQRHEVSGGNFLIYPNGKKAQISGGNREIIDFSINSVEFLKSDVVDREKENIFEVIRNGMNLLFKYVSDGQNGNIFELKKYFINTKNPELVALFDVENIFKEKNEIFTTIPSKYYDFSLESPSINIISKDNTKKAIVYLDGKYRNAEGTNASIDLELELIFSNNKWYINGLSTFSDTDEYLKIKNVCNEYIKLAEMGETLKGKFKGKHLTIGQIQFWQISEPKLASKIEESNYCKVYIKVTNNNNEEEEIYKVILHKELNKIWLIQDFQNNRLSYLY